MRSDLIRVTKPTWVRIVNPEPFALSVLGYDYRYGDVLLTRPGGVFQPISEADGRVLTVYRGPHPPHDRLECPSDALVFASLNDLRMMAQGRLEHTLPVDPELKTGIKPAAKPPCRIEPGQRARVPASRQARVIAPSIPSDAGWGGVYRDHSIVTKLPSTRQVLRPGGVLTAMTHRAEHVCVRYTPAERYAAEQCEDGAWCWMAAIEFITMETRYQTLRLLEEEERKLVIRLRNSV